MEYSKDFILNIKAQHSNCYHKIIKRDHPTFYQYIESLDCRGDKWTQKLYNWLYPELNIACHFCGKFDNKFIDSYTGYHEFCNKKCQSEFQKTDEGFSRKMKTWNKTGGLLLKMEKRRETCVKKYGVPHHMMTEEKRLQKSQSSQSYWKDRYPPEVNGRTKKQYTAAARHLTNKMYRQHQSSIDPNSLRGKEWYLDHVFSISDGYLNGVPLDVICHPSNLVIMYYRDNSSKGLKSAKSLTDLYDDVKNYS